MKLAAIYTLWDYGMLEQSYKHIRPYVDGVIFSHQHYSNHFKECDEVRPQLGGDWINYVPNGVWNTKRNERIKYLEAIDYARSKGYTHFILMAHDHFYKAEEIEFAKKLVIEKGYKNTATRMFTYYKYPTWQVTPIEDYYMPFITEITPQITIRHGIYPVYVDPACCFFPSTNFYEFKQNEVMLHHYSMVRKDIRKKFENAASKINWIGKIDGLVEEHDNYHIEEKKDLQYFTNRTVIEVNNYFNI